MKKSLIALAALWALGVRGAQHSTCDVAFTLRMGAGFAGDVNRTHPVSEAPYVQDGTTPIRKYGDPALYGTNTVKGIVAGDASDSNAINIAGVLVRDFPTQMQTSAGAVGQQLLTDATTPPQTGVVTLMTQGRMMVRARGAGNCNIGAAVYIFCTADEAGHVQGGFENAFITTKTVKVANAQWRGPADASGMAEIEVWPGTTIT